MPGWSSSDQNMFWALGISKGNNCGAEADISRFQSFLYSFEGIIWDPSFSVFKNKDSC